MFSGSRRVLKVHIYIHDGLAFVHSLYWRTVLVVAPWWLQWDGLALSFLSGCFEVGLIWGAWKGCYITQLKGTPFT